MSTPGKANPAVYSELRKRALQLRLPGYPPNDVQAVIMDWHLANATVTVLAAADGTASIYLSSGGGFIGGSQSNSAILEAALEAIRVAQLSVGHALSTHDISLPPTGSVYFFFSTNQGLLLANAPESTLRNSTSALAPLGSAMQRIMTEYRHWDEQSRSKSN